MFQVYEEAELLLNRLPAAPAPIAVTPTGSSKHTASLDSSKLSSDSIGKRKKNILNSSTRVNRLGGEDLDLELRETLYIKEEEDLSPAPQRKGVKEEGSSPVVSNSVSSTTGESVSDMLSKDGMGDSSTPTAPEERSIADGGIVLLTRQLTGSSTAGADISLSDWEGLSTDSDNWN